MSNQVRRSATAGLVETLYMCLYELIEGRSAVEVEDYLSTLMDQEFDTIVEDGSITEVHLKIF